MTTDKMTKAARTTGRGRTPPTEATQPRDVAVSVRLLTGLLTGFLALVLLAGVAAALITLEGQSTSLLRKFVTFFHLDKEINLPAFVASSLILCNALVAGATSLSAHARGDRWWVHWALLAVLLAAMSLDEAVSLHERLQTVVPGSMARGIFYFTWVIPMLFATALIALLFLPFVLALPGRTRNRVFLAGAVYCFGALGVEMATGAFLSGGAERTTWAYQAFVLLEEGAELAGQAILFHALLEHIRQMNVRLRLSP